MEHPTTIDEFLAAYQLREVLDGLAARLAASSADTEGKLRLGAFIERQRAALDPWDEAAYSRADVGFHTAIVTLAGNPYLEEQLGVVRATAPAFLPIKPLDPAKAAVAIEQHRAVLVAVFDGDGTTAEARARSHIRWTVDRVSDAAVRGTVTA